MPKYRDPRANNKGKRVVLVLVLVLVLLVLATMSLVMLLLASVVGPSCCRSIQSQ
jgi:hypothetical protein